MIRSTIPLRWRKKFGVPPAGRPGSVGTHGDSSDNVPGVPAGVGQKTAAKLLQEFGSLEEMYSKVDDISQKRGEGKDTKQ